MNVYSNKSVMTRSKHPNIHDIAPDSDSKSNPTDICNLLHLADTSLYNMYIMYLKFRKHYLNFNKKKETYFNVRLGFTMNYVVLFTLSQLSYINYLYSTSISSVIQHIPLWRNFK